MQQTAEQKKEALAEILHHIQKVMDVIELYEQSRPGSLAFIKLEEAIMWSQVLVNRVQLKNVDEPSSAEVIEDVVVEPVQTIDAA